MLCELHFERGESALEEPPALAQHKVLSLTLAITTRREFAQEMSTAEAPKQMLCPSAVHAF